MPWTLFVKHTNGKSLSIIIDKQLEDVTVTELKQMVEAKIGIPPEEQMLVFSGKQLEDSKNLSDYEKLGANCTVFLVMRLEGGASSEKERDTPAGLPASKTEPCLICGCHPNDDSTVSTYQASKRMPLVMPCPAGHTVMHPHCLIMYTHNEVFDNKKTAICCPQQCKTEWSLDVIEKYGVATKEEISLLAECLSENMINSDSNIIECPGCHSYCLRKEKSLVRVRCRICAKEGKNCEFCWHCLKPWSGSSTTECGHPECKKSGILAQIQSAPFKEVVGVSCPSIRLCPDCGTAIQHKEACKHMTCKVCQCNFCFICLRQRRDSSWQCGSYNTKCTPAPVQDRVPMKA